MPLSCPAPSPFAPVAQSLADYVDCQALALGHAGFQGQAGALVPGLLVGCLTIYVGLIGYRILLGYLFGPREAVMAAIRVGLVLAFVTSWPSYESVVYRVVVDGPGELVARVLGPSGLAAPTLPETAGRLQRAYETVRADAGAVPGLIKQAASVRDGSPGAPLPQGNSPAGEANVTLRPTASAEILNPGEVVLLVSTVGAMLAIRLASGLLLAVGPLFIVLGLFDTMMGLFEGWVRSLATAFVASAGVMVVVALELGFVEAELAQLAPGAPEMAALSTQGLMLIAIVFALAIVAVLIVSVVIGRGFRLPRAITAAIPLSSRPWVAESGATPPSRSRRSWPDPPPRARAVADAITALSERERVRLLPTEPSHSRGAPIVPHSSRRAHGETAQSTTPLGHTLRRRPAPVRSGVAVRRDNRQ